MNEKESENEREPEIQRDSDRDRKRRELCLILRVQKIPLFSVSLERPSSTDMPLFKDLKTFTQNFWPISKPRRLLH